MAKNFVFTFGSTAITGLNPTFTLFKTMDGTNQTSPGITQIPTSSGLYYFTYGPTATIAFTIDGATTNLVAPSRFIFGSLDPIQAVDEQLTGVGNTMQAIGATLLVGQSLMSVGQSNLAVGMTGIGNTLLALGSSFQFGFSSMYALIGTTASSFGSTSVDPGTVYGYLKRLQEFNEGDSTFNKTSGVWDVYSRGASTLLREKTLTDSSNTVTKS